MVSEPKMQILFRDSKSTSLLVKKEKFGYRDKQSILEEIGKKIDHIVSSKKGKLYDAKLNNAVKSAIAVASLNRDLSLSLHSAETSTMENLIDNLNKDGNEEQRKIFNKAFGKDDLAIMKSEDFTDFISKLNDRSLTKITQITQGTANETSAERTEKILKSKLSKDDYEQLRLIKRELTDQEAGIKMVKRDWKETISSLLPKDRTRN